MTEKKLKLSELIGGIIGATASTALMAWVGYEIGEYANYAFGISNIYARIAVDLANINLTTSIGGPVGFSIGSGFGYGISELAKAEDKRECLDRLLKEAQQILDKK